MSTPSTRTSNKSGPNLNAERTGTITEAVLTELAEVGYGQLSMDGVARRAKAGKSALYRRWSSKQDMILDALAGVSAPVVTVQRSHDLRTVITRIVESVDDWLSDDQVRRIIPDLLAEALRNPALDEALASRIGVMRRGYWRDVLVERMETGEVHRDADIEYAMDLLAAPLFWRICGLRRASSSSLRANVVESVLDVLTRPAV
jgi:AcrR family transcriptional regulator